MWAGVSVYLSKKIPVSVAEQVTEALTSNGASISHKFSPGKDIYILEKFDSDPKNEFIALHKDLKSHGLPTHILGTAAVLESAERQKSLPPLSLLPIRTRILEGTTLCISGTTGDKKRQVQMLISYMMGKYADALSGGVTHLLVQKAGTEKHQAALQYGIKLVRFGWLADSWRSNRILPSVDYLVRPFEGFVMAISGLPTERREEMRHLAIKHGGKISEDMTTNADYTHLIVDPSNINVGYSSKYWFVRTHCTDCKVVSVDWFEECIKRIAWLDEDPYLVTDEMVGFVPQEVRVTEEELKKAENSNPSEDIHNIEAEIQNRRLNNMRDNASSGYNERSNSDEEGNQYFDGCYIYLSGFTEAQNIRIKNMILNGGGVRWPTMDSKITHFIVGNTINQSEIDTFRSINISAPILASKWLLDCYKHRRLLPPDNYRLVPANPNRGTKRKSNENSHEYEPQAKRVKMEQHPQEDVDMDQELSSSPFDPNALFAKINFLVANFVRDVDVREVQGFIESQGGRAFLPTALRKLRSHGDRTLINYVVMPHGAANMDQYLDIITLQKGAPKPPAVSIHWLEVSLARKKLINPADCIVFRPFNFPIGHYKSMTEKFSICTSNFETEERENLELLIRLIGANYTPALKQRATTHLICKRPEGPKYEKAIECDIRVVTVQWLEECITRGLHVAESKHSFFGSRYNTSYAENDPISGKSTKSTKKPVRSAPTSDDLFKEDDFNNPTAIEEDEMSNSEYYGLPAEVDLLPLSMDRDRPLKQEREYDKEFKQEDPRISDVLKEVTIYVGKKLVEQQSELIDLVSSLGGSYSWGYDENVTHYIHEGRIENNREFALVKKNGTHIVSPFWLRKCKEENKRLAELSFPSTYNPSMSLGILTTMPAVTPAKSSLRTSLVQSPVVQQANKSAPNSTAASRKRKAAPVVAGVSTTAKKKKTDPHLNVSYFPSSPNSSPNEDRHENNASLLPSPSFRSQRDATGLFTRPVAATPSHHAIKKQPLRESKFFTIGEESAPGSVNTDSRDFHAKINAASEDMLSAISDVKNIPSLKIENSDDDNYHQNTETMTDLPNLEFLDALKQENSPVPEEDHSMNHQILEDLDQLLETVAAKPQVKSLKPKDTSKLQVEGTTRRISRAELLDDPFSQRARASDPNLSLSLNQTVNESIIRDSSNEVKSDTLVVEQTVNASIEFEQEEFDSQVIAYKSEMESATGTQSTQRRRRVSNKIEEGGLDRFLKALDVDEESQKKTSMANLLTAKPVARAVPSPKRVPPPKPVPQQLQPEIRINNNPPAVTKTPNRVSPVSNVDLTDKRKPSTSPTKTSPASDVPIISISGFENTDSKNAMPRTIKDLGGVFLKHFDSTCTHVIAHKPIRSEKYLGACAMGIWVLKSSYLDACQKAGRFVREEPYEWSAADATNPRERDLLEAARRWRLKLAQNNKKGAFDGWRVALYVVSKRQDGLRRVLESGGAVVVQDTPPFTNLNALTHIIIDKLKVSEAEIMDQFREAKPLVYATEYISDFIMTENPLPLESYDILGKSVKSTSTSPGNKRK